MSCPHLNFYANVKVGRLTDEEGMHVTGYSADITIHCTQCNTPFEFIGVPAGMSPMEPRVSVDFTELRAPIRPFTNSITTNLNYQVNPDPPKEKN